MTNVYDQLLDVFLFNLCKSVFKKSTKSLVVLAEVVLKVADIALKYERDWIK